LDQTPPPPIRIWGHLEILEKIGAGGFADVFRARDPKLDREVALKLLRADVRVRVDENVVMREGRMLAKVKHPNVVTVYGAAEHDGQLGLWMEFISGMTLYQILRQQGRFSPRESALVGVDVCRALAAIHAQGILHQDVKAQNVMREHGGRVVLMDLGVGIQSGSLPIGGTRQYRAPELSRGAPATVACDVYSLGVLLHYLVDEGFPTTSEPERPEEASPLFASRLRDLRPELPESFVRLIERALAGNPQNRFATVGDMGKALLDFLETSGPSTDQEGRSRGTIVPSMLSSMSRWSGRTKVLLGLVCLAALLTATWPMVRTPRTPPPPSTAQPLSSTTPVAVLLFQNLTGDPTLEWLRTGLTELMIIDLSQSPQLSVPPTDQILQIVRDLDGLRQPLIPRQVVQRVGERFSSRYVVLGSFFKAGPTFRLTVQIQDSRSGQLVATETAEGQGEASLFFLVDQLSQRARAALRLAPEQQELLDRELTAVTTASPSAFRYYAEALALQYSGKIAECLPLYEKAVQVDPGFALALSKLSLLYAQLGRDREAGRLSARAASNLERLSARERYYVEGNHYSSRQSTYGRALEAYAHALSLYPDHWPARHNLAMLYIDLERYADAISALKVNRRERPDMLPAYRYLALCYAAMGDFQAGSQILQELQARQSQAALVELGNYLTLWGKAEEAMSAFEQVRTTPASSADVDDNLWATLLLREDWKSLDAWQSRVAAEKDPFKRARYALYRSAISLYRGHSQDAIRLLRDVAGRYPEPGRTTATMHAVVAHILLESGQPRLALDSAAAARRDGNQDLGESEGLYLSVLSLSKLGDRAGAQELYRLLERETAGIPTQKETRRQRHLSGALALDRDDGHSALVRLNEAESLLPRKGIYWRYDYVPQHVPIWYSLGTAHLKVGNLAEAQAYFSKIVESSSERLLWPIYYVRSWYFLATIHEARGEVGEARKAWTRFLDYWDGGDMDAELVSRSRERIGQHSQPKALTR
jgi:serine/threonine-protein kinase